MGISVPAAGYLPLEFPDPRKVVSPGGVDAFRLREWAIPAAVIELSQVEIRSPRIRDAQSTRADISAGGFYICLVHGRRPVDSIQLPLGLKHPVLAIDLGEYAKRWIELCASRADSMREAIHAIEQLRRWLATESTGRRWMVHPQAVKIIERIKAEAETTKLARDEAWRQADAERQLKHQSHVARAKVLYAAQHARAKARREAAQAKQAEIQPRPAPAPAVKDDEFIAWERALCPLCKCQQWRVKAGSRHGPYIGRTILRCSIVVSHPVMILPVGT